MLFMRMSVPICYNFLQLTGMQNAAIYEVMGAVKYVSFLGEGFNKWVFPCCLLAVVFLTAFKIYGKILGCLGLR
jgi:LMBR1-like membrane protein